MLTPSFLLLLFVPQRAVTESTHAARIRLLSHLTENVTEVSISVPPANLTSVLVSVSIVTIFGLSAEEVLQLNAWFCVFWHDSALAWRPEDWSGVESLVVPAATAWKPDIGIQNAKDRECKDFSNVERQTLSVRWTGEVNYYGYCLSETPCPVVTNNFPFDEQACPLVISTFTSLPSDFKFNVSEVNYVDKDKLSVGEWRLNDIFKYSNITGSMYGQQAGYQFDTLVFTLQRKPLYHVVLVIIPFCLICALASVIFLVSDVAVRFGVSLTILLAMSVYIMIVSQGAPRSMITLSLLDRFLLVQMSVLVLLTFVIVLGPIFCEVRSSRAPKESDDGLKSLMIRGTRYRLRTLTPSKWTRTCDVLWLSLYLTVSIVNGVVCLIVLPLTAPTLRSSVKNVRDLPFNKKAT